MIDLVHFFVRKLDYYLKVDKYYKHDNVDS